jgi:hypothetical protein
MQWNAMQPEREGNLVHAITWMKPKDCTPKNDVKMVNFLCFYHNKNVK